MAKSFENHKIGYVFFSFFPLLGLISALKDYTNKHSKNIIWMFCAFFGYTFQITPEYGGDAARYKDEFLYFVENDNNIKVFFDDLFLDAQHVEFVERLISIITSRFTDNYHYLFLFYGVFYGYFLSRNIAFIAEKAVGRKYKGLLWILVVLFFMNPIWNINGFDFWTATHMFIYAVLPYIYQKKSNRLWLLLLVPFTHFSFYLIIFLTIIYMSFFKGEKRWLYYAYLFSFLMLGLSSEVFSMLFKRFIPDVFMSKFVYYTETAGTVKKTGGRIFKLLGICYLIASNIVFISVYKNNLAKIRQNQSLNNLFQYGFYIGAIFNILSVIPSMGRYSKIIHWVLWSAVFILIITFKDNIRRRMVINKVMRIRIVLFIFCLISFVRYLLPVLGVGSILSNPIFVFLFVEDDYVIGNIVKKLL